MKKTVLLYGSMLAFIIVGLKILEYQFLNRHVSVELYIVLIASLFAVLGLWAGTKLIKKEPPVTTKDFEVNTKIVAELGISNRELEVLKLMAEGLSNQEIAEKLFVSLSTIKTHSSNLFSKLDAKRRTQAIQNAKSLNIIP